MLVLDSLSLYCILAVGNLVMALLLFVFGCIIQFEEQLKKFMLSKLCQGTGLLIILFRHFMPEMVSILAGNTLLLIGIGLETFCLIQIGKKATARAITKWIRLFLFLIAAFWLITLFGAGTAVRVVIVSLIITFCTVLIAIQLLFYNNDRNSKKIAGVFFGIMAIPHAARGIEALTQFTEYSLIINSSVNTVMQLSSYVHLLVSTLVYLLINWEIVDIKLREAATKDFLTGIYNRMQFIHLSQKLFSLMIRQNRPVSLLIIDLDNFKKINDKYGHAAGDEALIHFTQHTAAILRGEDVLGRYGGEEFVVLLANTRARDAMIIAEKIRTNAMVAAIKDKNITDYTVSIGAFTSIPSRTSDITGFLQKADEALLQAKRTGKNKVVQFSE